MGPVLGVLGPVPGGLGSIQGGLGQAAAVWGQFWGVWGQRNQMAAPGDSSGHFRLGTQGHACVTLVTPVTPVTCVRGFSLSLALMRSLGQIPPFLGQVLLILGHRSLSIWDPHRPTPNPPISLFNHIFLSFPTQQGCVYPKYHIFYP